jgi:hypothetical protein
MARAQDEWVVKKIPGSGVACGVVRYGATAVLRSALVLKGALQSQISLLVLLFSIFVLTPFLLFFQYHKMLEKNKEWN